VHSSSAHSSPAEGVIGSFDTDLSDGYIACIRVATAGRIAGGLGVPSCSDLGEGHVGIDELQHDRGEAHHGTVNEDLRLL
jgi:hypothetical protein